MRVPNSNQLAQRQGRDSIRSLRSLGRKAGGPRHRSHLCSGPSSGDGPQQGSHGGEGTESYYVPTRQPLLPPLVAEAAAASPRIGSVGFAPGSPLGKLKGILTANETLTDEVLAQGPDMERCTVWFLLTGSLQPPLGCEAPCTMDMGLELRPRLHSMDCFSCVPQSAALEPASEGPETWAPVPIPGHAPDLPERPAHLHF